MAASQIATLITTSILLAATGAVADIAGWRSDGSGSFDVKAAPMKWSADSGVVWKTALPNQANASPILIGERLFVTAEPDSLVCISTRDGSIAWQKSNPRLDTVPEQEQATFKEKAAEYDKLNGESNQLNGRIRKLQKELKREPENAEDLKRQMAELKAEKSEIDKQKNPLKLYSRPATHGVNGYATPTPVSDGTHVYAQFGDGIVACYTLEGTRKWIRFVAHPQNGWGHSASPILVDGKLVVHVAGTVYALSPATGETIWTASSASSWGTPLPFKVGAEWAILTTGGVAVRASDGHILAKGVASMPWTCPIQHDGILYVVDERGAKALRIPEAMTDNLEFEELWSGKPVKDRHYASPVYVDGLLYAINRSGQLTVLDAASGETVYSRKLSLGGTCYPSITLAAGHLYVSADTGKTVVLKPGRTHEELGTNSLEGFRSNPVFANGRMYVRAAKHLYCIGVAAE